MSRLTDWLYQWIDVCVWGGDQLDDVVCVHWVLGGWMVGCGDWVELVKLYLWMGGSEGEWGLLAGCLITELHNWWVCVWWWWWRLEGGWVCNYLEDYILAGWWEVVGLLDGWEWGWVRVCVLGVLAGCWLGQWIVCVRGVVVDRVGWYGWWLCMRSLNGGSLGDIASVDGWEWSWFSVCGWGWGGEWMTSVWLG